MSANSSSAVSKERLNPYKSITSNLPILSLTPPDFRFTFKEWQDSLRVESVITKSTHFVALPEYPRISPHRAAWVSSLSHPSPLTYLHKPFILSSWD